MVLPLFVELQQGIGGSIDADLIRAVTGRIVIDRVHVVGGNILQIEYRDENNVRETLDWIRETPAKNVWKAATVTWDDANTRLVATFTGGTPEDGDLVFLTMPSNISSGGGAVTVTIDGGPNLNARDVENINLGKDQLDPNDVYPVHLDGTTARFFSIIRMNVQAKRIRGDVEAGDYLLTERNDRTQRILSSTLLTYINANVAGNNLHLIDTPSDLPTPSAATLNQWYFAESADTLFVGVTFTRHHVDPVGQFFPVPARANFGVVHGLPDPEGGVAEVDSIYYGIDLHGWHQLQTYGSGINLRFHWVWITPQAALEASRTANTQNVVFLGEFDSDDAAVQHILNGTAGNDYFYANDDTLVVRRLDFSTYVLPVQPDVLYTYEAIGAEPSAESGEVLLEPTYNINESANTPDGNPVQALGNLYKVGPREIVIRRAAMRVHPLAEAVHHLVLLEVDQNGIEDFRQTIQYTGQNYTLTAGEEHVLEAGFVPGGVRLDPETYFAIMAVNLTAGASIRSIEAPGAEEKTTSAHGFVYAAKVASTLEPGLLNLFHNVTNGETMEIEFSIEVDRATAIEWDGQHVVSSPEVLNFQRPLRVTREPNDAGIDIGIIAPSLMNPHTEGVLYCVVTNPGSGYTTVPTVTFSGGGGTNVAAEALTDGDLITAVLLNERGQDFTSAPTISIAGGGGSGATATAHIGRVSTISQDFTDDGAQSRMATSTFDFIRSLVEADRDKLVYVSFNPSGFGLTAAHDYVRAYVPPFPVGDLLDLPTLNNLDLPIGNPFENVNTPSLYLNTTRIDDPDENAGDITTVGANGLWLLKVDGGDTNRRFIMARSTVLRSIDNLRFELRV